MQGSPTPSWWRGRRKNSCQSACLIPPPLMDQHHPSYSFSQSCPSPGREETLGHSSQCQAGRHVRVVPPHPAPEGASRFLTVCHCSLLKENYTSQTFVWRKLDHHLPTNEARLCTQRERRRQVVCLLGLWPRSWHPRCL